MYKPKDCLTLKDTIEPQIRLGIQGAAGTGKTWSALTFPNPIVANLDRGLGAHFGRDDVIEVPFYSESYCKSINPNYSNDSQLKDTLLIWLHREGKKLEEDQTLVWDGQTATQKSYHKWIGANPQTTKQGKLDDYAEWRLKLLFFGDLMSCFKTLKCHVVYISHECERTKDGESTGKIRPLLTGQFCDELSSHFTDWFRQLACDKPDISKLDNEKLKNWNMTVPEFSEMCKEYPRNTLYYWQLEGDNYFDGKASSLVDFPRFIPANYKSFMEYSKYKEAQVNKILNEQKIQ